MRGRLVDAFEISGRGCVVLIDIAAGSCTVGDWLSLGADTYEITGIEMINYHADGLRRIAAGWKPPMGLLLRGAAKEDIVALIGSEVHCENPPPQGEGDRAQRGGGAGLRLPLFLPELVSGRGTMRSMVEGQARC